MADPMYRQIAEDLRRQIEAGELLPGKQLQTELELRELYNASRNTVRDAMKWLITRGLVETRAGQGTFVTERIEPFVTTLTGEPDEGESPIFYTKVRASLRTASSSPPRVEIQQATGQTAEGLALPQGALVVSRHQQWFIDGTPWSMQTSFYPMNLVERGGQRLLEATDITEGAVAYLNATLGIEQAGYRDQIKVRTPNETETAFFKLPDDGRVAVFAIQRTTFDGGGCPLRMTVTVYPADRNQFAVNVGRVPDLTEVPADQVAEEHPEGHAEVAGEPAPARGG